VIYPIVDFAIKESLILSYSANAESPIVEITIKESSIKST
jgi:hypothetical protein